VPDQLKEGRLGPVDVLEQEQQRLLASQRREEALGSPLNLLSRIGHLGGHKQGGESIGDGNSLIIIWEKGEKRSGVLYPELMEDISERPVGNSLAEGDAATDHEPGLAIDSLCEFACKT
jgi:hypothetical protein